MSDSLSDPVVVDEPVVVADPLEAFVEEKAATLPVPVAAGPVSHRIVLTDDDIQMVRATYAPDLNDAEARLFFAVAQDRGLDPRARQIHGIVRVTNKGQNNEKRTLSIQTSIDGFRLIAQRTGKYRGQLPVQWAGADGQWLDFWPFDVPPVAARAAVLHEDFDRPMFAVAMYREYVQTTTYNGETKPNSMWAKMGAGQLAKCAEALAFRRAFPEDLSGIYTDDEMGQADNEAAIEVTERSSGSGSAPAVAAGTPQGDYSYNSDQMAFKRRLDDLAPEERKTLVAWWEHSNYPHLSKVKKPVLVQANRQVDQLLQMRDKTAPFEQAPQSSSGGSSSPTQGEAPMAAPDQVSAASSAPAGEPAPPYEYRPDPRPENLEAAHEEVLASIKVMMREDQLQPNQRMGVVSNLIHREVKRWEDVSYEERIEVWKAIKESRES